MENRHYLNWVKTLPCMACGTDLSIDPHHILGTKDGGWNVKSDDFWAVPLCRTHHDELHNDPATFEVNHGRTQWEMSARTMQAAIFQGVLTWQPIS